MRIAQVKDGIVENIAVVNDVVVAGVVVKGAVDFATELWPHLVCVEAQPGVRAGMVWDGQSFSEPPIPELSPEELARFKSETTQAIDAEIQKIIQASSFEWPPGSGQKFSLTLEAQVKWVGLHTMRNSIDFVNSPLQVRTKDDLTVHTITSVQEVEYMVGLGLVKVNTILGGSVHFKGLVLAASSRAEIEGILGAFQAWSATQG